MQAIIITFIICYLTEVGGLFPYIVGWAAKKLLHIEPKHIPFVGCAKCMTFWSVLFLFGLNLNSLFLASLCSFSANFIVNLLTFINEYANTTVDKARERYIR